MVRKRFVNTVEQSPLLRLAECVCNQLKMCIRGRENMPRKIRCQFFQWSTALGDWYWCKETGDTWLQDRLYCQRHYAMMEQDQAEVLGILTNAG